MGLDLNSTRFLLHAKTRGCNFDSTAMIGRLHMYLTAAQLKQALRDYGIACDDAKANEILTANAGFAEKYLQELGASKIESYDNTAYEGATQIHDFNYKIGSEHHQQYTTVLDSGTLEHIFNFPIAVNNCLNMVKPGGYFISVTPANNYFGHGMYQFSPELYYSLLTKANGFEMVDMLVVELAFENKWYRVVSPQQVGNRITVLNSYPVYMMIIAKRISSEAINIKAVQQSDYVQVWEGKELENITQKPRVFGSIRSPKIRGLFAKLIPQLLVRKVKRKLIPNPFHSVAFEEVEKSVKKTS